MHLTISFSNGSRMDAVVLAATADRMRITAPGCEDAVEFTLVNGGWVSENGEPVEIEAMVLASGVRPAFLESRSAVCGAAGAS